MDAKVNWALLSLAAQHTKPIEVDERRFVVLRVLTLPAATTVTRKIRRIQ